MSEVIELQPQTTEAAYSPEWAAEKWRQIREARSPALTGTETFPPDPDADDSVFDTSSQPPRKHHVDCNNDSRPVWHRQISQPA